MAFNDVILFSDEDINAGCLTSNTTSAYLTGENFRFLSYPGQDNLGSIRISSQGLNPGFPYLVCKNI